MNRSSFINFSLNAPVVSKSGINDGDRVMISKGYHSVVAAPGYSLYYLWILSGETRFMPPMRIPTMSSREERRLL